MKRTIGILSLSAAIFLQACAVNFGRDLRLALAVSGPFIESLKLGGNKAKIVADFTEIGGYAATFSDSLSACKGVKSCELVAVETLDGKVEPVLNRDFGIHPVLQRIEGIVRGIIQAAKIYYAPPGTRDAAAPDPKQLEKDIEQKIKELKAITHGG